MMSERDRHIFKLFATRVREHFPEASIWAFGSRARGEATWESDLDICVVIEDLKPEDHHIIRHISWEVGFEQDMLICTILYSTDEFERGPCSESPLVRNILHEGVSA